MYGNPNASMRVTYTSFPYGTFIPGLRWSIPAAVLYAWDFMFVFLYSICLILDYDIGIATIVLPIVGGGVHFILWLTALFITPIWSNKYVLLNERAHEERTYASRRIEIAHFTSGMLVYLVMTVLAAIFQGKYTPTYPILLATDPFLWYARSFLYLIFSILPWVPLSTMFNTNALLFVGFRRPDTNNRGGNVFSNPTGKNFV